MKLYHNVAILRMLIVSVVVVRLGLAAESNLRLDLGSGISVDLVLIPAGEFTQGSPAEEPGRGADETARLVRISKEYYISRTSITRAQWERFVAETGYRSEAETGTSGGFGWDGKALVQKKQFTWRTPGFAQTADHPVCMVTFPDAEAFCNWLSRKGKRKTTLPTEAQWEYACRAGSTTPWHAGSTPEACDLIAWHKANSGDGTRPVNAKQANAWGLVIGGNVSDWCLDWYAPYGAGPVTDPRQDNPNLSDKPRRVLRGGSWLREPKNTRSAARYRVDPRSRNADIGFRVLCSAEADSPPPTPTAELPLPPKVEVEPGDHPTLPPVVQQEIPMPSNIRPGSGGSSLFEGMRGLLCLLIPVGVIIVFIKLLVSHGRKNTNAFVSPLPEPAKRPPVRKVDDGFWIDGDWEYGSMLRLSYMIEGVETVQELAYRPGNEGQFVFTGRRPDSVRIVSEGNDPHPPPLFTPTVFPSDPTEERESRSPRPPIFPAAY